MRILVVDDNANARDTLRMILELEGHEVETAPTVVRALEILDFQRPDVALVDIGLPEVDGYELARRVRHAPGLDGVRLIALTGFDEPEDRRKAREAGFDAHLAKPMDVEALLRFFPGPRSEAYPPVRTLRMDR